MISNVHCLGKIKATVRNFKWKKKKKHNFKILSWLGKEA